MQRLTPRERVVCTGLSNKQIALQLTVTEGTVKVHLHNVYDKLAIRNRTMLALLALQGGGGVTLSRVSDSGASDALRGAGFDYAKAADLTRVRKQMLNESPAARLTSESADGWACRPWPHQYAAIAASQLIPGRYAV